MDGARTNVYLDEVQVADFASFLEFVYTAKVQVGEDRVQRMLEMSGKAEVFGPSIRNLFSAEEADVRVGTFGLEFLRVSRRQKGAAAPRLQAALAPEAWASEPLMALWPMGLPVLWIPSRENQQWSVARSDPEEVRRSQTRGKRWLSPLPQAQKGQWAAGPRRKVFVEIPKKVHAPTPGAAERVLSRTWGCGGFGSPAQKPWKPRKKQSRRTRRTARLGQAEAAPPKSGGEVRRGDEEEEGEEGARVGGGQLPVYAL